MRFASNAAVVLDPCIGLSTAERERYHRARDFSNQHFRPNAVHWDENYTFPFEQVKLAAEQGYLSMFVTKEIGGQALSRVDSLPVIEALAAGCVGTASMICVHNMCASMIDRFGNPTQRAQWLPSLVRFERMASYCITEPGSGSDAASLVTTAVVDETTGDYVVSGSKAFISGAGLSDLYLVMCRAPQGITCLVMPKASQGLTFGKNEKKMGLRCTPTRQVLFDEVRVTPDNRLGGEGQGFKIAMSGLDGGRLAIGASSLGAAQACLEIAVQGLAGSTDQNVQFRLADMQSQLLIARQQLRSAAALLDQRHPTAIPQCALAKKVATDVGFAVCNEALHLAAGRVSAEEKALLELFVRGTRVHSIVEGTNEIMRHLIGKNIVA